MALKNLGIQHDVIGISEIDKNAIKMYNMIHGETNNFGDISQIEKLPYCDFLHFSSPCQSFSQSGKKNGLEGSSGIIVEVYRLMDNLYERKELPKAISFENVPTLYTKFRDVFDDLIERFKNWGYNVYYNTLSAQYFNNPTARSRLFIIGIRKDCDTGTFIMPQNTNLTKIRLKDYLVDNVDKKYYWPHEVIFHSLNDNEEKIDTTRKLGWLETACGHETQSNRVWSKEGFCPTITCYSQFLIREGSGVYRKLTEEEYWRIQGFSQNDFEKIQKDFSRSAIIKAVGNSIALGPLEAIYSNLFSSVPSLI